MLGLLFLHYNVETGDILGIFNKQRNPYIPEPNLEITAETRDVVMKNPRRYLVVDKKIVEKQGYKPELSEESLDLQRKEDITHHLVKESIEVNGFKYFCDQTLQSNIILGYIALQNKSVKSVKLWCLNSDDKWEFKEHSENDLTKLAGTFNSRRENASLNFHTK